MFLLDTNVVSELRRPRPHEGALAWLQVQQDEDLFVSALTIGEIQLGVERARRQDPIKANEIEGWLDQMVRTLRIIVHDAETYRIWARLLAGKPDTNPENALIAACAKRNDLTVVTLNVKHFRLFDVPVLDPFEHTG